VLVRRRSGGGTVYHDEGNTNYSVMLPRAQFERGENARLVAEAVQEMGVQGVTVTDRYDVCVGDRKVSGSAFRITSRRAYHHGTMLLSSDLARLKGALRPTPHIVKSFFFSHTSHLQAPAFFSSRSNRVCLVCRRTSSTRRPSHPSAPPSPVSPPLPPPPPPTIISSSCTTSAAHSAAITTAPSTLLPVHK